MLIGRKILLSRGLKPPIPLFLILFICNHAPRSAFPSLFPRHGHPVHDEVLVDGLAHVDDAQRGARDPAQRFHFHARLARALDPDADAQPAVRGERLPHQLFHEGLGRRLGVAAVGEDAGLGVVPWGGELEVDGAALDGDGGVREGDEVGGPLDGRDAGDAGDGEDVALLEELALDEGEEVGVGEADGADGDGGAVSDGFVGYGDLVDGGMGGEVGELGGWVRGG